MPQSQSIEMYLKIVQNMATGTIFFRGTSKASQNTPRIVGCKTRIRISLSECHKIDLRDVNLLIVETNLILRIHYYFRCANL